MYSNIEDFEEFDEAHFNLNFSNYEIWENNKLTFKGNYNTNINCSTKTIEGVETKNVIVFRDNLNDEISNIVVFDKYLSAPNNDLLLLLPENSNNKFIEFLIQITGGPTRANYDFELNQPYCCRVTHKDRQPHILSFFISGTDKVIEFY